VAESLCVLYVGVTRAAHVLHMIIDPSKKNEKSLYQELSGLLRATLTKGQRIEPGQIVYEHGDRQWSKPTSQEPVQVKEIQRPPIEIRLAPALGQHGRGLERVSSEGACVGLCAPSGEEGPSLLCVGGAARAYLFQGPLRERLEQEEEGHR